MKLRLVQFLSSPCCLKPLSLTEKERETLSYPQEVVDRVNVFSAELLGTDQASRDEIWQSLMANVVSGTLTCDGCKKVFQIEEGIPRLLLDDQISNDENILNTPKAGRGYSDSEKITSEGSGYKNLQQANKDHYSYEWNVFASEGQRWEKVYFENYYLGDKSFFQGKLGLDAGCGMARYSIPPVVNGAEIIGLDLSEAVVAAYKRSLAEPLFHVVQGDILNLPFVNERFDFIQSIGVLHHTPNPPRALEELKLRLKKGGRINLYLYPSFKDTNIIKHLLLIPVGFVRAITSRMSSGVLYYFLLLLLPLVLLFCYFPSWLLYRVFRNSKASNLFPYSYLQYKDRTLRDIHMNLFDRFGNPVERRYDRKEMENWMEATRFSQVQLIFNNGWLVGAIK